MSTPRNKESAPNFDYSISFLIILLMLFWFTCKCIGKSQCENMENGEPSMLYGDIPIRVGSSYGLNYINNVNGVIEVPNSKTAMRHLFDNNEYKCIITNSHESDYDKALRHLLKNNSETEFLPKKYNR